LLRCLTSRVWRRSASEPAASPGLSANMSLLIYRPTVRGSTARKCPAARSPQRQPSSGAT
jgi:hypothetical protein